MPSTRESRELAKKVASYLEAVCPPPGRMRWQDYLIGEDDNDRPVLRFVSMSLGITVRQLFDKAVERHRLLCEIGNTRSVLCTAPNSGTECEDCDAVWKTRIANRGEPKRVRVAVRFRR